MVKQLTPNDTALQPLELET